MDILNIMKDFASDQDCIEYLEKIRWNDNPFCPHCASVKVSRKNKRIRASRWNCLDCHSSFSVTSGTFLQGTKIPLQKWFLAVAMIVNAKKGISSHQLARDLKMNQKSAWYMETRIRKEIAKKESPLLAGIIEADETFLGGKPRRRKDDDGNVPPPNKRGRGTKKAKVLGAVERGGDVVARIVSDLSGYQIFKFITKHVKVKESELISDEWKGYLQIGKTMPHRVIKHSERIYVDSEDPTIHTNTIEGFWSLLKRAFNGTHHHYSKKYTPLYLAEACWRYNNRSVENLFDVFLASSLR